MLRCDVCSTTTDQTGRFCPTCGGALQVIDDDLAVAETQHGADSAGSRELVGASFDGFAIEAVLGGGSFGTVYRGRQVALDRVVAVKVPTHEIAADPMMARRFAREARAASRVQHPGIVAIHAVGELPDGRPYLAMQLVDGEPLSKVLADGPLPPRRALAIARQIASALSETHAAGVVHRDLKPSNIVWRRDRNGDELITIVDFGIALSRPGHADATRLTSGGLIGTPHYMAPEQANGDAVDAPADLYALGCVLFELVTGAPPYRGAGVDVLLAHVNQPVPVPSDRDPAVPAVIDALCARLLAKKPDERAPSADAVVALIDDALAQLDGGQAPRSWRWSSSARTVRTGAGPAAGARGSRLRWVALGAGGALALGAVAVIALGAAGYGVSSRAADAAHAPDDERRRAARDLPRRGRRAAARVRARSARGGAARPAAHGDLLRAAQQARRADRRRRRRRHHRGPRRHRARRDRAAAPQPPLAVRVPPRVHGAGHLPDPVLPARLAEHVRRARRGALSG